MKKTTTIHLNGRQFSIEEDAYTKLKSYLDNANAKLEGNPDKDEILKDLEEAIAEKSVAFLNAYKNVITETEIEKIIAEMGPVESSEKTETGKESSDKKTSRDGIKHLYLIKEGSVLFGVCAGLAAYFNIDVTIVRIAFIALAVVSGGAVGIAYIIMAIIVPKAETNAELAEARGLPFNAQEIIERARAHYDEFKKKGWQFDEDSKYHHKHLKEMRKAQREQWKARTQAEKMYWKEKYHHGSGFWDSISGIFWIVIFYFVARYLSHHVPAVNDLFHNIGMVISNFIEKIAQKIH